MSTAQRGLTRRSLTRGVAWSVPAVTVLGAAPALAASSGLTDLAIEVADPPTDPSSGSYVNTVPIYKSNQTSTAVMASISTAFTITNVGTVAAVNPTGTMDLQFMDYDSNAAVLNTEAAKFNVVPMISNVTWTKITNLTAAGSGNQYRYTYQGTLQPGQSVTIPVKIWVSSPFAHASAMQMLFSAYVADDTTGDWDDNSGRTGYIPSFAA